MAATLRRFVPFLGMSFVYRNQHTDTRLRGYRRQVGFCRPSCLYPQGLVDLADRTGSGALPTSRLGHVNDVAYLTFDQLPEPELADVSRAIDEVAAADGTCPLDEAAQLALRNIETVSKVVIARCAGEFAGLAQLRGAAPTRELDCFVVPAFRRRGIGARLVASVADLSDTSSDGAVLVSWAHGDLPGSGAFAESLGFEITRELWFMRRSDLGSCDSSIAQARQRDDVKLESFADGERIAELLEVNAAAFRDHPEQGSMSLADIAVRQREEWYSPADVLVASDTTDGDLLGFHWLKVTRGSTGDVEGEVYIIAVAPSAQGRGLGRYLLDVGLAHLKARGVKDVTLYVEKANTAAVALYEANGFQVARKHIQYRR